MNNATLHAVMDGVESTVDLGVLHDEFQGMDDSKKWLHMAEYLADVVDLFVTEGNDKKIATLHAVVDGVESTTDLGISHEDFEAMREKEQRELIAEYLGDVVDIFVTDGSNVHVAHSVTDHHEFGGPTL